MILQIQKKEYDREMKLRKMYRNGGAAGRLYFKGEDGRYYVCDKPGMIGAKEIFTFNRNFRKGIDNQTLLI